MKYILITTISLLTGFYIKSKFFKKIQTPNSPPTFNFTHDQLREIQDILDQGDILDKETQDKLDQDFDNILGEEGYNKFNQDIQVLQDEFNREVEELLSNFSNLGIDYTTILEIIDTIINFINY